MLPLTHKLFRLPGKALNGFLLATAYVLVLSHSALAQAPPFLWVAQAGGPKDDAGRGIVVDPTAM